jgi:hypothetical protein
MKSALFLSGILLFWFGFSSGQNTNKNIDPKEISTLKFLGEYEIPYGLTYDSFPVGGLSAIDYDEATNVFYLLSDDRGSFGRVRFYTVNIDLDSAGVHQVAFNKVSYLHSPENTPYANGTANNNPDPEGLRFNARDRNIYWVSEGERSTRQNSPVIRDPFIQVSTLNGQHVRSFTLPENLRMHSYEKGPRQNSALEGITFDASSDFLFTSVEEPLFEDGPRADTVPNGAFVRIFKFDVTSGKNVKQYAYPLESVAHAPVPANKFRINGISEILSAGKTNMLLTVERSFSTGRLPCTVKVFLTDLSNADDIINIESIRGSRIRAVHKKLLLNMDDLGIYIDNVEGVTFGPELPNGHRTLLFVTDNNFNWFEKTQLLLFEVIP